MSAVRYDKISSNYFNIDKISMRVIYYQFLSITINFIDREPIGEKNLSTRLLSLFKKMHTIFKAIDTKYR